MTHQWRHLKLLKRAGRGHDRIRSAQDAKEGECALLCPACPHPDINMPVGWEDHPGETIDGVRLCVRWQNYDGERRWKWKNWDGTPCARWRRVWLVQRMVWVRRGGRWHGEWIWEAYDRDEECGSWPRVNRRWLNMGNVHRSATVPSRSVDVPMEVLRYMLKDFNWVCGTISLTADGSHC